MSSKHLRKSLKYPSITSHTMAQYSFKSLEILDREYIFQQIPSERPGASPSERFGIETVTAPLFLNLHTPCNIYIITILLASETWCKNPSHPRLFSLTSIDLKSCFQLCYAAYQRKWCLLSSQTAIVKLTRTP